MLGRLSPSRLGAVLDIGVGTGTYLQLIASQFNPKQVVGIDLSKNMIAQAEKKLRGTHVELKLGDARCLPVDDRSFDIALMCRVASHIDDVDQVAREAFRVLRPGGWFILTDIDTAHQYESTRIPFGSSEVCIETHRHSADEWLRTVQAFHFITRECRWISSHQIKAAHMKCMPSSLRTTPDHEVAFVLMAHRPITFEQPTK